MIRLCALLTLAACGATNSDASIAAKASSTSAGDTAAGSVTVGGQSLCLDTMYDGMTAGSGVQAWTCDGMSNQSWTYQNNRLQIFGSLCLQAGTTPLQVQPCDPNNPAQQFTQSGNALMNQGQCLSVATLASETPVQLVACQQNASTQSWNIAATGNVGNGNNAGSATSGGNTRTIEVINNCSQTVYAGAFVQGGGPAPNNGGWQMPANSNITLSVQTPWSGRFWARTGCTFDASGKGSCQSGDCNGQLKCGNITAQPASLAEFTFGGYSGQDFYDVSLVDGFNVPISAGPASGSYPSAVANDPYRCGTPACAANLNATCPAALQHDTGGQEVACYNACQAIGGDQYCCAGSYASRDACVPNGYSEFFKAACPSAYSYPDDDATSTFTCNAATYVVTFCP